MRENLKKQSGILAEELMAELAAIPAGRRFSSVRGIQRKYRTNLRVVLAALERLKAAGEVEVIPQCGIFSNGRRFVKSVPTTMLILPEYPSALYLQMMKNLDRRFRETGSMKLIKHFYNYETESFSSISPEDCDIVAVVAPSRDLTRDELKMLVETEKPVLVLFKHFEELPLSSAAGNDIWNGIMAAEYLIARGHVKLGVVICEPRLFGISAAAEAFRLTAEHNQAQCIEIDCSTVCGEYPEEKARARLAAYLAEHGTENFTALYVICGSAAKGVMVSLREFGLETPRDVSIIGSGETPDCDYLRPPLTTVGVDIAEMSEKIAEMFLQLAEQPDRVFHATWLPEIHERDSVRAIENSLAPGK